jgi:hypothetical protein
MITVYTVIVANYDNLAALPVQAIAPSVRYVCFTDRPRQVSPWEAQPFPQALENAHRMSRIPKMLPHLLLPEADISVYMDGAFTLCAPPRQMVAELLGDADVALFHHPANKGIHDERNFYQRQHGFVPADVEAEYQRYCSLGIPISGEFWAGGFILRRHNERVAKFNELWMREFLRGSANDQFSLYYALSTMIREGGLNVRGLSGYYSAQGRLGYHFHANAGDVRNQVLVPDNQAWKERTDRIREICKL